MTDTNKSNQKEVALNGSKKVKKVKIVDIFKITEIYWIQNFVIMMMNKKSNLKELLKIKY